MRNICYIAVAAIVMAVSLSSCKNKKQADEDIIVEKVVAKPQNGPERMERDERNGSVTWISGAEYSYNILRESKDSLSMVENHDKKYYDNSICLTIYRENGSVFFKKTFTKANFEPALPAQFKKHGVLLGMNLEKAEGNNLRFIVSVGSPDDSNEEFYYILMNVNNYGATSTSKYEGIEVE